MKEKHKFVKIIIGDKMKFPNKDPKPIPKRQEKSAVDSYKQINVNDNKQINNTMVQGQSNFFNSNINMKETSPIPHEEIENLKKNALVSKHIGMENQPVKTENGYYQVANQNIEPSSFSHVNMGNMENPTSFGTTIMEEQGNKNVILEKVNEQPYVDIKAEMKQLEQKNKKRRRKMLLELLMVLGIILLIIAIFIIYQLTGPTSNKKSLFCVANMPAQDEYASLVLQKTYYSQKSGLYKAELQGKYVFSSKENYEQNIEKIIGSLSNQTGIVNETFKDDNNYMLTVKTTYNYKSENQVIDNSNDLLSLDLTSKTLEDIKSKEEQIGLKCNIK